MYRLQLNCGTRDVEEQTEVKSYSVDDRVVGAFNACETQTQASIYHMPVAEMTNTKDPAVSFRSSAQHRSHWTQQTGTKLELNMFANREGSGMSFTQ